MRCFGRADLTHGLGQGTDRITEGMSWLRPSWAPGPLRGPFGAIPRLAGRMLKKVQMRGGARRPHARRSPSTLSVPAEGRRTSADGPFSASCLAGERCLHCGSQRMGMLMGLIRSWRMPAASTRSGVSSVVAGHQDDWQPRPDSRAGWRSRPVIPGMVWSVSTSAKCCGLARTIASAAAGSVATSTS